MRNICKIISTILSATIISTLSGSVVFASENNTRKNISIDQNYYEFKDVPQEIIDQMKKRSNTDIANTQFATESMTTMATPALSSGMAKVLNGVGLNHSARLLNYSMLSMREEPYIIYGSDTFISDMWTYSTDLKKVVTSFLNEAKSKKSYEYFKTTTMSFNVPANKSQFLVNTGIRKNLDFFGALHSVNIYLGVVKSGLTWDMLVMIQDRYDFKKEEYNGLVDVVNNIAHHEQELGKIRPYDLYIYADRSNLRGLPYSFPTW